MGKEQRYLIETLSCDIMYNWTNMLNSATM